MKGAAMTAMTGTSARGLTRRAILAALIMALGALIAWLLTPTLRLADEEPIKLESMIPTAFGDWAVDRNASAGVVNPSRPNLSIASTARRFRAPTSIPKPERA